MNLAGHRDRRLSENYFEPCYTKYHLYKNLFRLTWKNLGSYPWVFTVFTLNLAQAKENLDAKHQVQFLLHIFRSHILRIEETVTFYTTKTKLK